MFSLKGTVNRRIIDPVYGADNLHGTVRLFQPVQYIQHILNSLFCPSLSVQELSDNFQFHPSHKGIIHFAKIQIQHGFKGFPPDIHHTKTFCRDLLINCHIHTKLGNIHQNRFFNTIKQLFYDIHGEFIGIIIFGKSPLFDGIIQRYVLISGKRSHIQPGIQCIIPTDRPHQIPDPVLNFHFMFFKVIRKILHFFIPFLSFRHYNRKIAPIHIISYMNRGILSVFLHFCMICLTLCTLFGL